MKLALCFLSVGETYQAILHSKLTGLERYAHTCGADLVVIDKAPDPSMQRGILSQKLLLPSLLTRYDRAAFLDLDIIINKKAPSIFDQLPPGAAFSAAVDDRSDPGFRAHWHRHPGILRETAESYFAARNYPAVPGLEGSINGGVLLFRPSRIADLFEEAYFKEEDPERWASYEEAPMAFHAQSRGLFHPLDARFNCQFQYALHTIPEGRRVARFADSPPIRAYGRLFGKDKKQRLLRPRYQKLVPELLQRCHILHFAGGFDPGLYAGA